MNRQSPQAGGGPAGPPPGASVGSAYPPAPSAPPDPSAPLMPVGQHPVPEGPTPMPGTGAPPLMQGTGAPPPMPGTGAPPPMPGTGAPPLMPGIGAPPPMPGTGAPPPIPGAAAPAPTQQPSMQPTYPGIVYGNQAPTTYNIPGSTHHMTPSAGQAPYPGSRPQSTGTPYPPSYASPYSTPGNAPAPYPKETGHAPPYPAPSQTPPLAGSGAYPTQGGYPGSQGSPVPQYPGSQYPAQKPSPYPPMDASGYPPQGGSPYSLAPSSTYPPMKAAAGPPHQAPPYPQPQGSPYSIPQATTYPSPGNAPGPAHAGPQSQSTPQYPVVPGHPAPYPSHGGGQPYPSHVGSQPYPPQATQPEHIRHRDLTADALAAMRLGGASEGYKKALVIGCNYPRTSAELKGCINDAKCMQYLLQSKFGFQESNIRLMTDDQAGRHRPTKQNILEGMRWLVEGHGSQKRDYTGDEKDGFNETLLPTDHKTAGQIVDDDVNRFLVNNLGEGVVLHAVIDACHSGTAMDLKYYTKFRNGSWAWKDNGPTRKYKGTRGGVAFQFGACKDSEVAQDTNDLSGSVHTGAATYCFIDAIEKGGTNQSYADVLTHMHRSLERLNSGSDPGSGVLSGGMSGVVLGMLMNGAARVMGVGKQTPMLSCTTKYDVRNPLRL